MSKLLKEPLLQFLAIGAIFYLVLSALGPEEEDTDAYTIPVNDEALLLYLQYQDKAFDTASATAILSGLDETARAQLTEDYIRDEIMVREALALGLNNNDEIIRGRLIQKMDYILQGFSPSEISFSEAEVQTYFEAHKESYREAAKATFTHVFFNKETRGTSEAIAAAGETLGQLNSQNVPFEKAGEYGDRFFFLKNYVNRPQGMITAHFGSEMAEKIFTASPSTTWIGPLPSAYGSHLVLVREITPSRVPALDEAVQQVINDMRRAKLDEARRTSLETLKEKYEISYTEGGD